MYHRSIVNVRKVKKTTSLDYAPYREHQLLLGFLKRSLKNPLGFRSRTHGNVKELSGETHNGQKEKIKKARLGVKRSNLQIGKVEVARQL